MRKLITAVIITVSLVSCKKEEVKLSYVIKWYTDMEYKGLDVEVVKDVATQEDFDRLGKPDKEVITLNQQDGQEYSSYEWTEGSKHIISDGVQIVSVEE